MLAFGFTVKYLTFSEKNIYLCFGVIDYDGLSGIGISTFIKVEPVCRSLVVFIEILFRPNFQGVSLLLVAT